MAPARNRLRIVPSTPSEVEAEDSAAELVVEAEVKQASYQAALAALSKVTQPSMIDFLR